MDTAVRPMGRSQGAGGGFTSRRPAPEAPAQRPRAPGWRAQCSPSPGCGAPCGVRASPTARAAGRPRASARLPGEAPVTSPLGWETRVVCGRWSPGVGGSVPDASGPSPYPLPPPRALGGSAPARGVVIVLSFLSGEMLFIPTKSDFPGPLRNRGHGERVGGLRLRPGHRALCFLSKSCGSQFRHSASGCEFVSVSGLSMTPPSVPPQASRALVGVWGHLLSRSPAPAGTPAGRRRPSVSRRGRTRGPCHSAPVGPGTRGLWP